MWKKNNPVNIRFVAEASGIRKLSENITSDVMLKYQKWQHCYQLPSLHCTVIVFALDWESHKSLKHDHECLTELLGRACFQPLAIQQIQLAEVGWESDKGFERKRGWVVCSKSCATVSVLV